MSVRPVPKCGGRRQSYRQVWDKSAVDCMRNAKKCPKVRYSTMGATENAGLENDGPIWEVVLCF